MPDKDKVIGHLNNCVKASRRDSKWIIVNKDIVNDALVLLKEQEDSIRILTSDLEDLQKEHEKLLDKKIPVITNGQEVVRCKDCLFGESCKNGRGEHGIMCYNSQSANKDWIHEPDWYCADGERQEGR